MGLASASSAGNSRTGPVRTQAYWPPLSQASLDGAATMTPLAPRTSPQPRPGDRLRCRYGGLGHPEQVVPAALVAGTDALERDGG